MERREQTMEEQRNLHMRDKIHIPNQEKSLQANPFSQNPKKIQSLPINYVKSMNPFELFEKKNRFFRTATLGNFV